jgi:hypothetical protein
MANRIRELIERRTLNSKSFLLDDGRVEVEACSGPIHYRDRGDGSLKDIVLEFVDDDSGARGPKHLHAANRMSMGFARDGLHNKFVGLRLDAARQFEISQHSIVLNGMEQLSGATFQSIIRKPSNRELEHVVNADVSVCHELRWTGLVGYVRTTLALTGFSITEELHLKGFSCTNQLVGSAYIADNGKFNFKDDTTGEWAFSVKQPVMWDESEDDAVREKYSGEVAHALYISGGKLLYEKTPTGAGVAWLSTAVGAASIDASIEVSGSTGDGDVEASSSVSWADAWGASTGTASPSAVYANCKGTFSAPNYIVARAHFFFTLSIPESAAINSADLKLMTAAVNGSSPRVMAMKSSSADPIASGSFDDFTGASYGDAATAAAETQTILSFNATGIADIVKNGVTRICVRQYSKDYMNSAPTGTNYSRFYTQDEANESKRPRLSIVYTAGFNGGRGTGRGIQRGIGRGI